MKRIYTCAAVVGAMLSASFVGAQPPSGTRPTEAEIVEHQVSRLTTLLNLTSAQQSQATAIFTDEHTAEGNLRASLRSAHSALKTAIESNDSGGITAQATQLGSLTTQEIEAHAKADAAFYALLSADQQAKYKQLHGPGRFGGHGFGHPPAL